MRDPPPLRMHRHVHAVRTTGLHAGARRRFAYADRCAQCGAKVDASTRVASHVLTYPCAPANCCVAYVSLQTCCRACNGKHRADEAGECCAPRSSFRTRGGGPRLEPGAVAQCCCVVRALAPQEARMERS